MEHSVNHRDSQPRSRLPYRQLAVISRCREIISPDHWQEDAYLRSRVVNQSPKTPNENKGKREGSVAKKEVLVVVEDEVDHGE